MQCWPCSREGCPCGLVVSHRNHVTYVTFFSDIENCCLCRYTGHVNTEFRIDSVISSSDQHVLSGSEDGCVYVWHLVDVSCFLTYSIISTFSSLD